MCNSNWKGKKYIQDTTISINGQQYCNIYDIILNHKFIKFLSKIGPRKLLCIHGDLGCEHIIASKEGESFIFHFIDPTPSEDGTGDVARDMSKIWLSMSGCLPYILDNLLTLNLYKDETVIYNSSNANIDKLLKIEKELKSIIDDKYFILVDSNWFLRSKVIEAFNLIGAPAFYMDNDNNIAELMYLKGIMMINEIIENMGEFYV